MNKIVQFILKWALTMQFKYHVRVWHATEMCVWCHISPLSQEKFITANKLKVKDSRYRRKRNYDKLPTPEKLV